MKYWNAYVINILHWNRNLIVSIRYYFYLQFGWNEVSFSITENKVTLQLNNHQASKFVKCFVSTLTMNLDQVTSIGEDFEGYIKKLDVNFVHYALTINDKVYLIYITPIHFSTQLLGRSILISPEQWRSHDFWKRRDQTKKTS